MGLRTRQVSRVSSEGEELKGFSAIDFDETVSALMHQFKENGISALAKPIGLTLVQPVFQLLSPETTANSGAIWLVPVAGGVKSLQKRGYSPAALIAKALLAEVNARHNEAFRPSKLFWGASLVWREREVADQAGLTGNARKTNLVGAMRASPRAAQTRVILVDDIVTTGSTLFETARALRAEGAEVLGFVTFAETLLRSFHKSDASS
jgi:predicted amidophosphoribosyltransferase